MALPAYLLPAPDSIPWLSILLLTPMLGLLLVGLAALLRLPDQLVARGVTAWMLIPVGLAAVIWAGFNTSALAEGQATVQFVEKIPWITAIRVHYFLGVDGLSLPLVLLTVIIFPLAAAASWKTERLVKQHYALLLLLEAAMLGYFLALDFFFWFIFWEFSLVPAFFLIQMWGREHRQYAAFKFFVYTLSGSQGMLLLFQLLYLATRHAGYATFDLIELGRLGQGLAVDGASGANLREILFAYMEHLGVTRWLGRYPLFYTSLAFWAIFLAFAIKLGVWPLHTWLPDAYGEAPTAGSIVLAALMSKMGAYGMLRILLPFVPDAAQYFAPLMGALALISIVIGAYNALAYANGDMKRLIAYTSINHMGYVLLAIASVAALSGGASQDSRAIAMNGAVMQLVAHGLSTGALFFLAGLLVQRVGSYSLADYGGLRAVAPTFAGVMGVALFANLGLPGLAGFVGEFFIFWGAWATLPLYTTFATLGLLITALALLLMFQRIFLGPLSSKLRQFPDLSQSEFWLLAPFLALLVVFGVYPAPLMNIINGVASQLAAAFMQALS